MSSLEATVFLGLSVIAVQLAMIIGRLNRFNDGLSALEKIREELCCEFSKSASGELALTSWGLRGIGEGIRSDLKDIREAVNRQ